MKIGVGKLLRMVLIPARLWRGDAVGILHSKAPVKAADCGSRQDRIRFAITLHGG